MDFKKEHWNDESYNELMNYLIDNANNKNEKWARNILQTKLELLVVPTKIMRDVSNSIFLGNFESFLNLKKFSNYESIAIYGMVLSKIKNFELMKNYLEIYIHQMENWAHCDLLSFDINKDNHNDFYILSLDLIKSNKVFIRRLGLFIMLILIKDQNYLKKAFDMLSLLELEDEYYIIMMAGWLLSECIIKYRDLSLNYLKEYKINPKIVNKGIQKCRESNRLNQNEKDSLLIFKVKKAVNLQAK